MEAPRLWDLPTRLIHWALALCVLLNLFFLEESEDPHRIAGYVAAGLVALRSLWGFIGARASRFSSFPIHPRSLWNFFRGGMREDAYPDRHNPLASLAYIGIWILVIGLGLSGWMMGLDAYWGEDWVEELHANFSLALQILLLLHLIGIFGNSLRYRLHLWRAMITGRRG